MATSQGVPTKIPVSRWQEVAKEGMATRWIPANREQVAIQGVATSQGLWIPANRDQMAIQGVATKSPVSRCQEVAKQGMATSQQIATKIPVSRCQEVAKQGMATSQGLCQMAIWWSPKMSDGKSQ